MPTITIKAESTFYAELCECSAGLLDRTPGLVVERRAGGMYLRLDDEIVAVNTLFARYLGHPIARRIFGAPHPLYGHPTVVYVAEKPQRVACFTARLLLAFLEVQLAVGFAGDAFQEHRRTIERILAGDSAPLRTNYYDPFAHRDNLGIHYVFAADGAGSGYRAAEWATFAHYCECAMRHAFALSPETMGGSELGLERALAQCPRSVMAAHARDRSILMYPIRHWTRLLTPVLGADGATHLVPCPKLGKAVPYIPLIDALLDMPYRGGALIIFQSICGSR